jgi:hypothetical protein
MATPGPQPYFARSNLLPLRKKVLVSLRRYLSPLLRSVVFIGKPALGLRLNI